ncbi:gamma-glutamyltransferase [Cereibacter changlensis JA139]|uniref:Glutathione hydrolase proenzyme n=2 Tax=Cereibacter changlensis TaxID=402884 RepID=A0A2T4JUW4_9RHOB|nr:gamma-glutamyltransferase [Cereibacter changlensis]PTE21607.1 gamma-glutamyltransferase [Cereibacter changlensis JA139]PZX56122.1 gamma-glutamyltranspeptidase/glutathione hydrolase [Cereibacter changlensis]
MHDFFSARRPSTLAGRAMVATSHPLSTAAGLAILSEGGNAVDAALAAVAVQCVVDPLMTGIGGDCFALYAPAGGEVIALNGSGRAPAGATIEALNAAGLTTEIPGTSPHAITIPGAVSGWCLLHRDHGTLPLDQIFARAIGYAEDGYPVTPRVAQDWAAHRDHIAGDTHAAALFLPDGRAPLPGERHAQPLLADRLREIAAEGASGFYEGETAAKMAAHLQSLGGLHTVEDFAEGAGAAHWVTPIRASYRGYDVHECPPNGQGLAALLILRIMEGFDIAALSEVDRVHLHAEATKLAYHHRDALLADAGACAGLVETLLSDEVVATLRSRIDMNSALPPALWDEPEHKDTVYLCVVDEAGNAISLINSIFHGFGSTRLDPATGVLFHSRGASFRLIPGHPNAIAPGKRPMHTIIPGMLTQDGKVEMPFGVMGGHYQAAGHAALLSNIIDLGMGVQAAMDAPRSFAFGGVLEVEPTMPEATRAALAARGHEIKVVGSPIGGSQAIRMSEGLLEGGSDSRKDGMALGY